MNRRRFLLSSLTAGIAPLSVTMPSPLVSKASAAEAPGVAVLAVDVDRRIASIDERIYGHFLEHINHSVVDGLFAEQIRGCGFEGDDFKNYWEAFSNSGSVEVADIDFQNGKRSVRLRAEGGQAGIRQNRLFVIAGQQYNGSLWIRHEQGSAQLTL